MKKMVALITAIILALYTGVQCEITTEDGVLVLDETNFEEALELHPLILVEFYAPWCGHCKNLAPEYSSATETLAAGGASAKLAKVDATENKGLASKFGVKGYPTLKFFRGGQPSDYTGGRTAETIVAWVNKKSGPPAPLVASAEDAEQLIEKNPVMVFGFFKDAESENAKAFIKAAEMIDDQVFGIISDESLFSKYQVEDNSVLLLKKFDEGKNLLEGESDTETIVGFVNTNSVPLVVDFNQKTAQKIFGSGIKGHFMLFSSAADEDHQNRISTIRKIAKDFKGELMFVSVTTDEEEHKRVLDFFGIWDTPTFRICQVSEDFVKFAPENSELTEENIRDFIAKYQAGELEAHLKTEDVPEDWDKHPVKVLVGKNFADVAMDSTKDVLVEFYAPWCGHCKKLAPIWEELGEKFKDDTDIVIAKMDSTANEVKDLKIRGFPTIKLFKKDNSVVDFTGERTLEGFADFLRPKEAEKAESESETKKDEL